MHAGREFVFVHSGRAGPRYGDQVFTLGVGDSAYFDSSLPHRLRQLGSVAGEVIVVTHTDYSRNR